MKVNQRGEVVAVYRILRVMTERKTAAKKGKNLSIEAATYTDEEFAKIEEIYAAETVQGASKRNFEDVEKGDTVTYQIVGDDEADIKLNKISISSPFARALIGKYAGDAATVQAPGGARDFEIVDVRYE